MEVKSYSVKKTIAFFERILKSGVLKPGDRLPSIRSVTQQLKVSRDTVQKAVRVLSGSGLLDIQKKEGIRVPGGQDDLAVAYDEFISDCKPAKYPWQKIAEYLKNDIFTGVFKHEKNGRLPPIKELKNRYNAAHQTIKKATESLKKTGIIAADNSIEFQFPASKETRPTIILILGEKYERRENLNDRRYLFMRLIETECKNINVHLEILTFSDTVMQDVAARIKQQNMLLGFIVALFGEALRATIGQCINSIAAYQVPVAVVDEDGELARNSEKRNVGYFLLGSGTSAGNKIAQTLLSCGHKQIAFISDNHRHRWSQQRYFSLKKTFEQAGPGNTVHLFARDDLVFASGVFSAGNILKTIPAYTGLIESSNAFFRHQEKAPYFIPLNNVLSETIDKYNKMEERFVSLRPLFENARMTEGVTAWVCADDSIALPAFYYLKSIGVRIPEKMSVVGFEDTYEAFFSGLTTYNFDVPTCIARCLRFIQFPKVHFGKRGMRPVEIVGHVIERVSVGPVAKSM